MVQKVMWFFFFSSRRRHTRWPRDWSSDVALPISKVRPKIVRAVSYPASVTSPRHKVRIGRKRIWRASDGRLLEFGARDANVTDEAKNRPILISTPELPSEARQSIVRRPFQIGRAH